MKARLVGEATYNIRVEPPPPAYIERYGKVFVHCGTIIPEGVHVYRVEPFRGGRTIAKSMDLIEGSGDGRSSGLVVRLK